jgi:hypothetical protein
MAELCGFCNTSALRNCAAGHGAITAMTMVAMALLVSCRRPALAATNNIETGELRHVPVSSSQAVVLYVPVRPGQCFPAPFRRTRYGGHDDLCS